MKLFQWFFMACLAWGCCLGASRGQDVVEPSVVNVDLEMQQFRKDRAAIIRYCVLLELCCEIVFLEGKVQGDRRNATGVDLVPERFAEECPSDFQRSYIDVLKMMDRCLREGAPEWQEMQSKLDDACKRFDHQYDLNSSLLGLMKWLDQKMAGRKGESLQERLKLLHQWKKELESGKAVIPDDIGSSPEGGREEVILNSRMGKMLFEWQIIKAMDELWNRELDRYGIQGEGIPVNAGR